ncbi:MAG: HNH endonuclease [Ruminococcus sp.]|nr:HNH endonuclease [Ruminococcus sp.]
MCKKEHKLTKATTAHHIKYLRDAPELAYERSNLMPLCHDCHERIHGRGIYAKPKGFINEERW